MSHKKGKLSPLRMTVLCSLGLDTILIKYNISKGGTDDSRTYKKFQELVDRGIIQGKRHGKSKNSHVYYNKGEIKKAFAEVEIMQRLAEAEGRR